MAWASQYQAEFTKPLIRQLLAFIQRDQRAALDWVAGQNVLTSIADYQTAPRATPQFPYVLLYADELVFDPSAVGSRAYACRLICEVAAAHQNFQQLAEIVQDYARAIDAILMTLPLPDFYQSWPLTLPIFGSTSPSTPDTPSGDTTPLLVGSVKELFVVRHKLGRVGRIGQGFAGSALIEIHVDREEL